MAHFSVDSQGSQDLQVFQNWSNRLQELVELKIRSEFCLWILIKHISLLNRKARKNYKCSNIGPTVGTSRLKGGPKKNLRDQILFSLYL